MKMNDLGDYFKAKQREDIVIILSRLKNQLKNSDLDRDIMLKDVEEIEKLLTMPTNFIPLS